MKIPLQVLYYSPAVITFPLFPLPFSHTVWPLPGQNRGTHKAQARSLPSSPSQAVNTTSTPPNHPIAKASTLASTPGVQRQRAMAHGACRVQGTFLSAHARHRATERGVRLEDLRRHASSAPPSRRPADHESNRRRDGRGRSTAGSTALLYHVPRGGAPDRPG